MKRIIRTIMISAIIAILTACSGRNVSMETEVSSEVSSENVVTSSTIECQAPMVGQHSVEILKEYGYDDAAIEKLMASGVVTVDTL